MKKIKIILIVLIFFTHLSAQPFGQAGKGYHIDKLKYKNASGESGTTYFQYDRNELLYKALWTLDNSERWSINYYERDNSGNLCSAYREFSDSLFSYENFHYDKKGNKIAEYFYRSDGISGMATYEYKKNKCIQANYKKYKGWLNGTVFYYYENNKKTHADLIMNDEVRCKITYKYDTNDNLTEEYWDFQGQWSQTFMYEYKRTNIKVGYYTSPYFQDLGPYLISKEEYTYNNEVGGPSYYNYNEKGYLETKIFERSDGVRTTTFFTYQKNGQLKTSSRYYSDESKGVFIYSYDEHDHLVKREFFKDDTLVALESHLYNPEGKLIKTYLKNFDGWLNGTLDYEHDNRGNFSRGIFQGEDGFNAIVEFAYNEIGLLTEFIWKFSTGDFQKYTFEYKKDR
jgi:hypothetical protein